MSGRDNTDAMTATDTGIDAMKAITFSDKDVLAIATKSDGAAIAGAYEAVKAIPLGW